MNPQKTGILAALAAVLFAFIFFFERHTPDTQKRAEQAEKLFPNFNPATVDRVELIRTNQALRAERDNRLWKLTAPVAYPAQPLAIENLLAAIGSLHSQPRVPPKPSAGGLAAFGLAPPQARLIFQQNTNHIELRFGARTPVGDKLYFQLAGAEDVLVTEAAFLDWLPRSADDWRDPALLSLAGLNFNRLEVRAGGRGFEIQRDLTNAAWRLTKPMLARADNPRIEHLLGQMTQWRAAQFVTDDPKAELEPFGLQTPEVELAFAQGTNELLVLQFGKSPTNDPAQVYARRLSHTNIVLVPRAQLEPLRAPFSDYRDRRLVDFSWTNVDLIEVRAGDYFTVRRLSNDTWRVNEPLNFAADAALVRDLLLTLAELEVTPDGFVKDVVTDFSGYGLAPPQRHYTLQATVTNAANGPTNLTLVQVDFGTNQLDKVFVRRADENSVYTVPYRQSLRLPQAFYQLRDRRIWNFASSNVVSVTVKQQGQTRKLVRDAAREWTVASGSNAAINPFAIEATLQSLGEWQAVSWVARGADKKAALGFPQTALEISLEVLSGDKTRNFSVEFRDLAPTQRPYAATTLDGEWIIFEFPAPLHRDVLRYLTLPAEAAVP